MITIAAILGLAGDVFTVGAVIYTCVRVLRMSRETDARSKAFDAEIRAHLDASRKRFEAMSIEIRSTSKPTERN